MFPMMLSVFALMLMHPILAMQDQPAALEETKEVPMANFLSVDGQPLNVKEELQVSREHPDMSDSDPEDYEEQNDPSDKQYKDYEDDDPKPEDYDYIYEENIYDNQRLSEKSPPVQANPSDDIETFIAKDEDYDEDYDEEDDEEPKPKDYQYDYDEEEEEEKQTEEDDDYDGDFEEDEADFAETLPFAENEIDSISSNGYEILTAKDEDDDYEEEDEDPKPEEYEYEYEDDDKQTEEDDEDDLLEEIQLSGINVETDSLVDFEPLTAHDEDYDEYEEKKSRKDYEDEYEAEEEDKTEKEEEENEIEENFLNKEEFLNFNQIEDENLDDEFVPFNDDVFTNPEEFLMSEDDAFLQSNKVDEDGEYIPSEFMSDKTDFYTNDVSDTITLDDIEQISPEHHRSAREAEKYDDGEGAMCKTCVSFASQALNQLINIILQGGVVGGCAELCGKLPGPSLVHVTCNVLCDVVGIKGFINVIKKADLDPIYYCEMLTACPYNDHGDAKFTSLQVVPSSGPQGTFNVNFQFSSTNGTSTGQLYIRIKTIDKIPAGGTFLVLKSPPGLYNGNIKINAKPDRACDPSVQPCEKWLAGKYMVQLALCAGQCGSKHPHSKFYDDALTSFTITE